MKIYLWMDDSQWNWFHFSFDFKEKEKKNNWKKKWWMLKWQDMLMHSIIITGYLVERFETLIYVAFINVLCRQLNDSQCETFLSWFFLYPDCHVQFQWHLFATTTLKIDEVQIKCVSVAVDRKMVKKNV